MFNPESTVIKEHMSDGGVYVLTIQEQTWSIEFYDHGDLNSQWVATFNNEYDAFHLFDAIKAGRVSWG